MIHNEIKNDLQELALTKYTVVWLIKHIKPSKVNGR